MSRIDLEDLAVEGDLAVVEVDELGADLPVGLDIGAVVVEARVRGVGDGPPESLRRGSDEYLVDVTWDAHWFLQESFECAELRNDWHRIAADPAVVDEPDRDGVEVVELLATDTASCHQAGLLQKAKVLHDAEAGHRQRPLKLD